MTDGLYHTHQFTTMALLPGTSDKAPQLEPSIGELGTTSDTSNLDDEDEYASGVKLILLIISLMLGMFLVALDNVCISRPLEHNGKH